jgi:hypothetical protein
MIKMKVKLNSDQRDVLSARYAWVIWIKTSGVNMGMNSEERKA